MIVYKYDIPLDDYKFSVMMPSNSKILKVMSQKGISRMWVEVKSNKDDLVQRNFVVMGTGHDIQQAGLVHVDTWYVHNDDLVFHLFEALIN